MGQAGYPTRVPGRCDWIDGILNNLPGPLPGLGGLIRFASPSHLLLLRQPVRGWLLEGARDAGDELAVVGGWITRSSTNEASRRTV